MDTPKPQEAQIKNIMQHLKCTREEAEDVIKWDKVIDQGGRTPFDMTREEEKEAVKIAHIHEKTRPGYQWSKRERKANPTKGGIIAELAKFLEESSEYATANVTITNKERQIAFSIGDEKFELTLVQKRKPKS